MEAVILLEALVISILVLLNGILAGAEIAIVSLRSTRLQQLVEQKTGWALSAQVLRENPEKFLATVQVGITVIGTTAGAFGGSTLAIHLIPVFKKISWLQAYAEEMAVGIVIVFISYLSIVAGELVPKSLAMRNAEVYVRLIASPLLALSRIATPAVRLLAASSNMVLGLFGDRTSFTEARLSSEELRYLVEDAAKTGSIHPETSSIASRAIEFEELRAVDVMVPRHVVVSLPMDASLEEVAEQLKKTPFSRLPIHSSAKDEFIGYLATKDLVIREGTVKALMRSALYVPESTRAISLLQKLQKEHQQMAFVVDEQGSCAGIVTMEDLLEELVGEIFSEFREERHLEIRWEADGSASIPGATPLRVINRQLDLELKGGAFCTTLGGLCLNRAGHIPSLGEKVELNKNLQAEVLESQGARLLLIRLHKI